MKSLFAVALVLALLVPAVLKADDKKDDKKNEETAAKLLGDWEITKSADDAAVGALVTFDKDGKLLIKITIEGKEQKIEGTWKLDEKGKLITESGGAEDTDTIKKLTADAMELENKDGKVTVMKKKK
jgi:uncharacterized protein (TIGR03066 family)